MGQFVSRVHNKQDDKLYNILPMGNIPTVVFGRVIREHSVPGMQYYFADGRVKFHDGGKEKRDNVSNGGGWDAVIPFTEPKKFSVIKFDSGDGETWLYKRYKEDDDRKNYIYAWAYVNNSANHDIFDSSIDWTDIDYSDILYTDRDEEVPISYYDTSGEYEVLDFNSGVTSDSISPTQIPVIFTVPEDLDFSKMKNVEYVRQFCRTARRLNANTVSPNFVIIDGKITCIKQVNFGVNKILSMEGDNELNNTIYNSGFFYRYLKRNSRKRREQRRVNNYKMHTKDIVSHCIHNEFDIIPTVKRNKHYTQKVYKSIYSYKAYRYGCGRDFHEGNFTHWKWKLK